ncbi:MAG: superoxide dismutase [Ni] [Candidatus Zixiibacteriota bacterium]
MMKSLMIVSLGIIFSIFLTATNLSAHCEIPCGIYEDSTRFYLISEDIATIEKSMDQITSLSATADKNYNQIVRWITNKEAHADKLMEIVSQYFLTQRIAPVAPEDKAKYDEYLNKVSLLHQMLVAAMKCKQTTDKTHIETLKNLLAKFREAYFKGK